MEFREMRRRRQQLTTEECLKILKTATAGTLALLGDGNYLYAVPISFVQESSRLYFHSATSGHKIDAINKHGKASFCVIAQDDIHGNEFTTYFRSVIAFGRIQVVTDEDEKLHAAQLLGRKYNPHQEEALAAEISKGLARMSVIRLDIEHLTGKEAIELVRQKHHEPQHDIDN